MIILLCVAPWLFYYVLLRDYEYFYKLLEELLMCLIIYVCQSKEEGWCYYMTEGAREDYLWIQVIENGKIFLMKVILDISVL